MSTALRQPSARASATTIQTWTTSEALRTVRMMARTIIPAWTAMDKAMADSREPIGRIAVLEDTNGDGKMDKRTEFMDGLVLPRALKVLANGVLVGEPPNLWYAKDTDGDLKADTKELVRNDYGRLEGNLEHNANSLWWALDNWIYTSEHDWYLRWKNGKFEVQKTLSRGQWGVGMVVRLIPQ